MKKLLLTFIALTIGTPLAWADSLVIKGSDTLGAKLVPQLAEEFKAQYPGTNFDIAAEGSTTGMAAIIDGTAAIGMSSRPVKPEEIATVSAKGVSMKPTIVAYDGIAVIVNSGNPIRLNEKAGGTNLHCGCDRLECSRRIERPDFRLHTQHFIRDVFRIQGTGNEKARLRAELAENGGQRANCR